MIDRAFAALGRKFGLTSSAGLVYGNLQGTLSALSTGKTCRCISIYVGAHEETAQGMPEGRTVSCANQIVSMIRAASGEANVYQLLTGSDAEAVSLQNAGCVVAVNFSRDDAALEGIERFITEVLPRVAPLTRPQQCIDCCQMTGGLGVPVKIDDAIVPMHPACAEQIIKMGAEQGVSLPKGILGAVLGALLGGVAFALLYGSMGYWAGICTLLVFALAYAGYMLLKGPSGKARILTLSISTVLASVAGIFTGLAVTLSKNPLYTANREIFEKTIKSRLSALKGIYSPRLDLARNVIVDYPDYPGMLTAALILSLILVLICVTWLIWRYRIENAVNNHPRIVKGKI